MAIFVGKHKSCSFLQSFSNSVQYKANSFTTYIAMACRQRTTRTVNKVFCEVHNPKPITISFTALLCRKLHALILNFYHYI